MTPEQVRAETEGRVRTRSTPDDNTCERCPAFAPWSILDWDDDVKAYLTKWFACNRHLAVVMREADWEVDAVEVRYLDPDSERDL